MPVDRPYHHGSLREAALHAARQVVESRGHDAVSMRELAQGLGVTPTALYRHFANRSEVMLAVANQGFEEVDRLGQLATADIDDPWLALEASLRTYLDFSERHVRLFLMMYDDEVINSPQAETLLPGLNHSYNHVAGLLLRALPGASERQIRLRMIALWSTLFGYASVRAHNHLKSYMVGSLTSEEMLQAISEAAIGPRHGGQPARG